MKQSKRLWLMYFATLAAWTTSSCAPSIVDDRSDWIGVWFTLTSFGDFEIAALVTFKEDGSVIVDDSLELGGTQLFGGTPEVGFTNSAVRGYWNQSGNDGKAVEFRGIQFLFDPEGNPVSLTASFGNLVVDESNPKQGDGELNINRDNRCTFFDCPVPNLEIISGDKYSFTATKILEPML